ncbi:chitin synthesis regulation, resistance to congo red-domain-containing protein [Cryomyces antarcticus]
MLLPRQYGNSNCYIDSYGRRRCNSAWSNWARWLVLALIILAALFICFIFSFITARRRRRAGMTPWRGTGWAAGRTPPGHGAATYNPDAHAAASTTQPYWNNNAAAQPGQQSGIELQQPAGTYQPNGGYGAYAPPKDPPPGFKNDGIIR